MGSVSTIAFVVALTTAADVQLLFFTSQSCLPCQHAKPVVAQLASQGYPIVSIDVNQQPQVADQFQITQIPCFVLTVNGQEVRRALGNQPAQTLVGMIESVQQAGASEPTASAPSNYGTATNSPETSPAQFANLSAPPRSTPRPTPGRESASMSATDEYNGWRDGIGYVPSQNASRAQATALASTVRLHVDENNSMAVGSGTVIHQEGNSALVLTCGHLFREAGMNARVTADVGFPSNIESNVEARVLYYDADKHDVALVVIRPRQQLAVAKLASSKMPMRQGDQVFGIGCGGGDDPTILATRIKALTNYSGVTKYDTYYRPEQGRSGGGLFSAGGQLIGICNAAAVNIDEGIYAGLDSIYMALESKNLLSKVTAPVAEQVASNEFGSESQVALSDGSGMKPIPSRGSHAIPAMGSGSNPARDHVQPVSVTAEGVEIICVVRDSESPSGARTVVVRNPSPELLRQIEQESQRQEFQAQGSQGSRIPPMDWQAVSPRTANVRAQSPN